LNPCYPELIYRTGDLGRWEDGELYFAGRKDFQIKYMGHRIELEEIERAMMEVPAVERAVCVFDEKKSRLYGFYVGTVDKKELHSYLKEQLPVYMVPNSLTQLEKFPVTKNGKVDRKALRPQKKGRTV
jgi:acyl-coenzyme A synthetase/AMP-(fatty) acid ligase